MTEPEPKQTRVIEWLTTAAKGRCWEIEPAWNSRTAGHDGSGPIYLLNYYAVRYGYDLVLAS